MSMSPPRNQADECVSFPDCSFCCEACQEARAHPVDNPEVRVEIAVAEALREMRDASGEEAGEKASEDAFALIAGLRRRGFAVTPAEPVKQPD